MIDVVSFVLGIILGWVVLLWAQDAVRDWTGAGRERERDEES